jgi:hypothetical protein
MSQRVKDIHRDWIIADQCTEPHSPWQNPDATSLSTECQTRQ